jgi:hypothetical protein
MSLAPLRIRFIHRVLSRLAYSENLKVVVQEVSVERRQLTFRPIYGGLDAFTNELLLEYIGGSCLVPSDG